MDSVKNRAFDEINPNKVDQSNFHQKKKKRKTLQTDV